MTDNLIDFVTEAPAQGDLDVAWFHGVPGHRRAADPLIQVHHYDEHTVILRQSKSVSYEAPFMFLLFGNDRALLLDSGATEDPALFPLRDTVDQLIAQWRDQHPREHYELVVAHTHGHGDHVAGDVQFADRPGTTVVSREIEAVQQFFGFTDWPAQVVTFDLGGRVLEITGSPGHHRAAITIYDPWSGFLLTGDTVLPGRLYVEDCPAFVATLDRMVELAQSRTVTHVLGCHIEMKDRPRRDYPLGATYQPHEHPLPMTVSQLTAVRDATVSVASRRGVHKFDDFIVYNQPPNRALLRLIARGKVNAKVEKARAILSRH
ncbi:MAG TPA: MBL fold metallo-hydrolase [Streptosporangiaceae bacterium]|jgi:glyoxylase-like metal-dependent hydrolase (beta-lactamase superfamily II)